MRLSRSLALSNAVPRPSLSLANLPDIELSAPRHLAAAGRVTVVSRESDELELTTVRTILSYRSCSSKLRSSSGPAKCTGSVRFGMHRHLPPHVCNLLRAAWRGGVGFDRAVGRRCEGVGGGGAVGGCHLRTTTSPRARGLEGCFVEGVSGDGPPVSPILDTPENPSA